jgi:hypothetical protein
MRVAMTHLPQVASHLIFNAIDYTYQTVCLQKSLYSADNKAQSKVYGTAGTKHKAVIELG